MEIPRSLSRLADKNRRTLYNYDIDDSETRSNWLTAQRASLTYYGQILTGRLLERLDGSVSEIAHRTRGPETEKSKLLDEVLADRNIGMLLVRPEMYHHSAEFSKFLESNGYAVLHEADKEIGIHQFEQIYSTQLLDPGNANLMPTNTMTYLHSPCKLVVFSKPQKSLEDPLATADEFVAIHKGQAGVPDPLTLRGSIVYDEAKRLGFDTLANETIAEALDPMGIYRHIIGHRNYRSALAREDKLLEFTGVGAHVPNSNELYRDLDALCNEDELNEILFNKKFDNIRKYRQMWDRGQIDKPLMFMISGYAGTGKSTLVERLMHHFPHTNVIQTGVLRTTIRGYESGKNPFLLKHTYDLDTVEADDTYPTDLIGRFLKQVEPIAKAINEMVKFASTEKQHWMLDGNHILANYVEFIDGVVPIEVYLKVSDPEQHYKMMCGPTHSRTMDERQRNNGRKIHDYMVESAISRGKQVYEFDQAYELTLKYINNLLGQYVNGK